MTRDKFQIVGDSLTGHGLSFAVARVGMSKQDFDAALVEMAEAVYRQGRDSAIMSYEDRFDLHGAVEALRALSVIVGPTPAGDRYRRCSDIIARLLHEHEAEV